MKINAREFSNSEITVTYDPCICKHADNCAKQLSNVFRDSVIPWIDINGASSAQIIKQVNKCPTGALKYYLNKKEVA